MLAILWIIPVIIFAFTAGMIATYLLIGECDCEAMCDDCDQRIPDDPPYDWRDLD